MRPDKPHKPWLQVWRDWLDSLPLRNEPAEPELSADSFGVAISPKVVTPRAAPEISAEGAAPAVPPPFAAATEHRPPAKSSPDSV